MFQGKEKRDIPFKDLLSWIFGDASYDSEKPIYVDAHDPAQVLNRRQAKDFIRRLIAGLKAHGFQNGDRLCFHSMNNIWHPIIALAAIGAGGCYVASNPAYSSYELQHILSVSKANFLIVEPSLLSKIMPACEKTGMPQSNIFLLENPLATKQLDHTPEGLKSWIGLLSRGASVWTAFDDKKLSTETLAVLLWTSGTTGLPKAAACSHFGMVAESVVTHDPRIPYECTRLIPLLLSHSFGVVFTLVAPLRYGITNFIMRKYDPELFLAFASKYRVTEAITAPPMIASLLLLPHNRVGEKLKTLRSIFCGGAALSVPMKKSFQSQLMDPQGRIIMCWGMTECLWTTRFYYPEQDDTGSVGRLHPNKEARIVDERDEDVQGPEIPGEILIRSPSMFRGYLDNPEATQMAFVANSSGGEPWLRTGDVGYMSVDGRLYIVDRAKDIIKVRGWQVSPVEIEDVIRSVSGVADVAVVGARAKDGSDLPRAYVVLQNGSSTPQVEPMNGDDNKELTANAMAEVEESKRHEIQEVVKNMLASWKKLEGGVKFVPQIPRGPSGKILRNLLREMDIGETEEGASGLA